MSPSRKLPPPSPNQVYVEVSALEAGHLTLPEHLFITDADPDKRVTVPSLSFLIKHPSTTNPSKPGLIVFDLGLKRDLTAYPKAMHAHIANRQPCGADPDVAASLRAGGIDSATDITTVVLSHTHWDHIGTPTDFPNSNFIVGSGTLHLLKHGAPPHYPANTFDPNLLPEGRTLELPPAPATPTSTSQDSTATSSILKPVPAPKSLQTNHPWSPLSTLPHTVDLFSDGSFYLIDAPGHLHGHINALCRLCANRWVYLGGDCCHDMRILSGEKGIGEYEYEVEDDGGGGGGKRKAKRSVHVDTEGARGTVGMVREFVEVNNDKGDGDGDGATVEVVIAHGWEWARDNRDRFLPGCL